MPIVLEEEEMDIEECEVRTISITITMKDGEVLEKELGGYVAHIINDNPILFKIVHERDTSKNSTSDNPFS